MTFFFFFSYYCFLLLLSLSAFQYLVEPVSKEMSVSDKAASVSTVEL